MYVPSTSPPRHRCRGRRCSHEHLVLVATFIDHARLTRGWLQLLTSEPIPDIETTAAEQAAAT